MSQTSPSDVKGVSHRRDSPSRVGGGLVTTNRWCIDLVFSLDNYSESQIRPPHNYLQCRRIASSWLAMERPFGFRSVVWTTTGLRAAILLAKPNRSVMDLRLFVSIRSVCASGRPFGERENKSHDRFLQSCLPPPPGGYIQKTKYPRRQTPVGISNDVCVWHTLRSAKDGGCVLADFLVELIISLQIHKHSTKRTRSFFGKIQRKHHSHANK